MIYCENAQIFAMMLLWVCHTKSAMSCSPDEYTCCYCRANQE